MTLSLLCCAQASAEQVAAVLAPLRGAVGEVVICDTRASPDDAYAALGDRIVRLGEPAEDGVGAWPYDACANDWILRIDDDEIASSALVDALPELIEPAARRQVWLSTRRLLRDGRHWMSGAPHWPGFVARLVRNDGTTRFGGPPPGRPLQALPAAYVDAPVYRLADPAADGDAATAPVDERDVDAIAAVIAASPGAVAGRTAPASPPRPLGDTAYSAEIRPLERELHLRPGESRTLFVEVVNRGGARWPWGLEQAPLVRFGYRLRGRDAGLVWEGPRSSLTEDVHPGESSIVPVRVDAPDRAGTYEIGIDLVHEHVRWFGSEVQVGLVVGDTAEPQPAVAVEESFELTGARYDLPRRAPDVPLRPYVVCATPRSGSTLLCRALAHTRAAGVPAEYLNPVHRAELRQRWGASVHLPEYVETLLSHRTTSDGVFGIKVHWNQLEAMGSELGAEREDGILEGFLPGLRHVRIVRRDLDQQVVSLWVALTSGQWNKTAASHGGARLPPYDFGQIEHARRVIEHGELGWERSFRLAGISTHTVVYEDLAERYEDMVREVLRFLDIEDDHEIPPSDLVVQRDAASAEILERYRADRIAASP